MKVLFVRPPRYMWPMNSESSSYWQPLGFASMAAVLRDNDFEVEILDCLPLRVGWNSLRKEIERRKPDILCVGDETASYYEAAKLIKRINDQYGSWKKPKIKLTKKEKDQLKKLGYIHDDEE